MELILVRHGLPERSHHTSDPSLSETGRDQAGKVGARLGREPIGAVWSSTMKRAMETAEPLATATGLPLQTHEGICEYDKNDAHYIPDEVLRTEDPTGWREMIKDIMSDTGRYDFKAFREDVVGGMEEIIREHPGERVAVFCHGGVINIWTAHVLDMAPRLFFSPNYTSINRFDCARSGTRSVRSLNEFPHLLD